MFDDLWNDDSAVEDIKDEVLRQVQVLYKENTPQFIYFVTLYHIFNQYLDELTEDHVMKTRTGIKETEIWNKLYQFQKDGAIGIIEKIEKFGGCILADSVGLGKTFTALAVVKYYELRNDRVLVLARRNCGKTGAFIPSMTGATCFPPTASITTFSTTPTFPREREKRRY